LPNHAPQRLSQDGRRVASRACRPGDVEAGGINDPGERDRFALGSEAFCTGVRRLAKGGREIVRPRLLARRLTWEDVLKAVAQVTGEAEATLMQGRGPPGRPLAQLALAM
jgi:hypothetical protein